MPHLEFRKQVPKGWGICPVSDNQEMAELVFEPWSLVFRIMETFTIIHSGLFQIEVSGINNLLSCNDIESGWIFQIASLGHSKLVHYCSNSLLGQPSLSKRTSPHLCLCVLEWTIHGWLPWWLVRKSSFCQHFRALSIMWHCCSYKSPLNGIATVIRDPRIFVEFELGGDLDMGLLIEVLNSKTLWLFF